MSSEPRQIADVSGEDGDLGEDQGEQRTQEASRVLKWGWLPSQSFDPDRDA
jgi:hypothetical protein